MNGSGTSSWSSSSYAYDHYSDSYNAAQYLRNVVTANVVSVIGFGASILLLCTHLIVYSITEDMWTLTGNSLASFCLSLMLSYCAYIGGIVVHDTSPPCTIVALLAFYFFLTNSSWLLSISLQLYHANANANANVAAAAAAAATRRDNRENTSTAPGPDPDPDPGTGLCSCSFVRYSLFSWLQPALYMGATLYVETYNVSLNLNLDLPFRMPKNLRVDLFPLGTNCFHKNTGMLLWFLLLFNVNLTVTFAVSAFTSFVAGAGAGAGAGPTNRRHQQQEQQSGVDADTNAAATETKANSDGQLFILLKYYMRLSLLVGFVWIVGMAMIYFKAHLLQVVFAISNAVLALYIFLVFTFNNKLPSVVFSDQHKSYDMQVIRRHRQQLSAEHEQHSHNFATTISDV